MPEVASTANGNLFSVSDSGRSVAGVALAFVFLAPWRAAAADASFGGRGGTGSATFAPSPGSACLYSASIHIERLRVVLAERIVEARLSARMTEGNQYCDARPLGSAEERYRLRSGSWDGHALRLTFASAAANAAKNTVTYSGTLRGNAIEGNARFVRYDCSAACNWTVAVHQNLALQP